MRFIQTVHPTNGRQTQNELSEAGLEVPSDGTKEQNTTKHNEKKKQKTRQDGRRLRWFTVRTWLAFSRFPWPFAAFDSW